MASYNWPMIAAGAGISDIPPTIEVDANAGTGSTATLLSGATDQAGIIELDVTGVSALVGAQLEVTFNQPYATAPSINIFPGNAFAATELAALGVFASATTTGFTLSVASPAITAGLMQFNYQILGGGV